VTTKHVGDPTVSPHQLLPLDLDENRGAAVAPAHHFDDIAESDERRAVASSDETPATENLTGFGIRARYVVASFIAPCSRYADDFDTDCPEEGRPIRSRVFDIHIRYSTEGALPDAGLLFLMERSGFLHYVRTKLG
jgi:hypothetical protein